MSDAFQLFAGNGSLTFICSNDVYKHKRLMQDIRTNLQVKGHVIDETLNQEYFTKEKYKEYKDFKTFLFVNASANDIYYTNDTSIFFNREVLAYYKIHLIIEYISSEFISEESPFFTMKKRLAIPFNYLLISLYHLPYFLEDISNLLFIEKYKDRHIDYIMINDLVAVLINLPLGERTGYLYNVARLARRQNEWKKYGRSIFLKEFCCNEIKYAFHHKGYKEVKKHFCTLIS